MMPTTGRNRGFALVVTLWALVGASALAITTVGTARDALGAAQNRSSATQAYWTAYGCLERARFAAYHELWPDNATPEVTKRAWTNLDAIVAAQMRAAGCHVAITPAGLTADVNSLDGQRLRRLLRAAGVSAARADSLSDALLDWRDADDTPRSHGAERSWYADHHRSPPRNDRIAASAEIRLIRGFGELAGSQALLGVEIDRVLWTRASRPVLASLPGMTDEALEVFYSRRQEVAELGLIGDFPEMPAFARDTLARHASQLLRGTTAIPDAWIISASAASGTPPISATIELKVVLADRRLIVVRSVILP